MKRNKIFSALLVGKNWYCVFRVYEPVKDIKFPDLKTVK